MTSSRSKTVDEEEDRQEEREENRRRNLRTEVNLEEVEVVLKIWRRKTGACIDGRKKTKTKETENCDGRKRRRRRNKKKYTKTFDDRKTETRPESRRQNRCTSRGLFAFSYRLLAAG